LTIAGVAVFVAVFARSWWRGEGGSYAPHPVVVSPRITPESSLFGDVLNAGVDIAVNPKRLDPASVQLDADFRPYRIRSQRRRVVRGVGRSSIVEFRYSVQCITAPCIALESAGTNASARTNPVRLAPARLVARDDNGRAFSQAVHWPTFVVHSRLSSEDVALATPSVERPFSPGKVSWS